MRYMTDDFADSDDLDSIVEDWATSNAFYNVRIEQAYGVNETEIYVKINIEDELVLSNFRAGKPREWYNFSEKLISDKQIELENEAALTQSGLIAEFEYEMIPVLEHELINDYLQKGIQDFCKEEEGEDEGYYSDLEFKFDVVITISENSFDPEYLIEERENERKKA